MTRHSSCCSGRGSPAIGSRSWLGRTSDRLRGHRVRVGDIDLRAVIFDMDGVLVDSEPVHFEATRLLLQQHGIVYGPDEEENFYGCTDREVFRQLRERYGLSAHEDDLAEDWIERVVELLPQRIVPMAGVPSVLEDLQADGVRLALASSSSPAIIKTTITGLGLTRMFETTVSGRDVAEGKPAPTSSWRQRGGSPWTRPAAWSWRTRGTACARRRRPAFLAWSSRADRRRGKISRAPRPVSAASSTCRGGSRSGVHKPDGPSSRVRPSCDNGGREEFAMSTRRWLELSARNQLRGIIEEVHIEGLLAEVRLRVGDQVLTSIITRDSALELGLERGEAAIAVIKSTEVMIGKEEIR